jgi:hypothetical protein
MSQKKEARQLSDCQIIAESAVISTGSTTNVPAQKRKLDAEEILYLNRV